MSWFRLPHLGLLVILTAAAVFVLLGNPPEKLQGASAHLSALLETPAPAPALPGNLPEETLTIGFGAQSVSTSSSTLLKPVTADEAMFIPVTRAVNLGRSRASFLPFSPIQSQLTWDETKVRNLVASLSAQIDTHTLPPGVSLDHSGKAVIFPGKAGVGLDEDDAVEQVLHSTGLALTVTGNPRAVGLPLAGEDLIQAQTRAERLVSAPLTFTAEDKTLTLSPAQIASLIIFPTGFDDNKISNFVTAWAQGFDITTVEPELNFTGNKIATFKAPVDGRRLDQNSAVPTVKAALAAWENTGDNTPKTLVVQDLPPQLTLASLNSLGITDRLGRGESAYYHSIPNRVYNVALATSRIHGKIVQPGETFSFNQTLGEVSQATGFKQAYVIDQGQTVLGDGGGVCQVSSTFFRALLDAGLPILARRGHSYRVGYYEQNSRPGFDATVSAPSPDLTFLNDTGAPILINAQADSKTLHMYIELYGKKDGRTAQVLNYRQWDSSPALPPAYQDDPTLPAGTLKQVDFAAGGLKTSFEYKVTYPNGNIKDQTYLTTYVPWQARYLRGTGSTL